MSVRAAGWKPRQSKVSREGQEGWAREAQAVQDSHQGARAEPEGQPGRLRPNRNPSERPGWGRSRGDPAKQEPCRMARVGLEGQSREALAKEQPWRMARAGPEGQTRRALARQEARAEPAAWQAARVTPAGQEAWVAPTGRGAWVELALERTLWAPRLQRALEQPLGRQRAPGWPPGHVGQRKPPSSSSSEESEAAD